MKTSWEKAKEIPGDALKLAPAERPFFLKQACAELNQSTSVTLTAADLMR